MANKSRQEIQDLVQKLIYPFYQLERDMLLPIRPQNENDAEHSWSLAVAACALAHKIDPSLDLGKVSQYAIVHDLVEVYAGDVSVFSAQEVDHSNKEQSELDALHQLQKDFATLPWLYQTIVEYERKDTNEARYIWSMDKYVAMYMRLTYAEPYFKDKSITKQFFDASIARLLHKAHAHLAVGKLYDELIVEFDAHPEWFADEKST